MDEKIGDLIAHREFELKMFWGNTLIAISKWGDTVHVKKIGDAYYLTILFGNENEILRMKCFDFPIEIEIALLGLSDNKEQADFLESFIGEPSWR